MIEIAVGFISVLFLFAMYFAYNVKSFSIDTEEKDVFYTANALLYIGNTCFVITAMAIFYCIGKFILVLFGE